MSRYDRIEEVRKGAADIDHIEEVKKFNPYHDSAGRFSSSNGTSGGYNPVSKNDVAEMQKEMGQNISDEDWRQMRTHGHGGYFGTPHSFMINKDIRSGNEMDDDDRKTVETIDRNMKPSSRDIQVVRMVNRQFMDSLGIDGGDIMDEDRFSEMEKAVGKVYVNKAYQSTSYDLEQNKFKMRDVKLNVNVPKGTKMLIRPDGREAEILLAKNTAMKITGVRKKYDEYGDYSGVEVDCVVIAQE